MTVKFLPDWLCKTLDLERGLALGTAWHFLFARVFALNGLVYVGYTLWAGYWRHLRPTWRTLIEAVQVALHDLWLRKSLPPQGCSTAPRSRPTAASA